MAKLETAVKDIHSELIEACRYNDRDAQVKLYDMYAGAMYNTSLRIVGHTAAAEDIMQEAFIEAFKKINTFRGEGSFGSWLKRIVINRSINHIRGAPKTISLDESNTEPEDPQAHEDEYSENMFCRIEEIRDGINSLPDSYRIILSLHLIEGYDHQEIAEMLNTSYGNVRTRFSRAKQKLLQVIVEKRK
ncbi:MAG: RNA polymerase sigma factor [Bacteroidales bacterium]